MSLQQISKKFGTDKFTHGFSNFYDKVLRNEKNNIKNILEIGILNGSSLLTWKEYFKNAKIHGIDFKNKKFLETENIITYQGKQEDTVFLNEVLNEVLNKI